MNREIFFSKLNNKLSNKELEIVKEAYSLAKYGHRNQTRKEGVRYFEHPRNVALILMDELKLFESRLIVLALLHDIIEDTFILSEAGLKKLFGKKTVDALKLLTKTGNHKEYIQKLNESQNLDAIIVKFADRLHNVRTLNSVSSEKKEKKITETRDLYYPVLERYTRKTRGIKRSALIYLEKEIKKSID